MRVPLALVSLLATVAVSAFGGSLEVRLPDVEASCDDPFDAGEKCAEERYFFDTKEGKCMSFKYKGRRGNANNFVTEEDCMRTCPRDKDVCTQKKSVGKPCKFKQWYYSDKEEDCAKFTYKGKGGWLLEPL
jgi:hypothetical protein